MVIDLTTYATDDDYRARLGDKGRDESTILDGQLLTTCRLMERSLGLAPGAFNSWAEALTFDGPGRNLDGKRTRLWLRDTAGRQFFLQSIEADGVGLDTEQDGTFDGETLDPTTADKWVVPGTPNEALIGESFRYIDILQDRTDRTRSEWLRFPQSIQVTATWGHATIPPVIVDLVVHRCQELREGLKGGSIGELPGFDSGAAMSPQSAWMWREVEERFGRKAWAF